MATFVPSGNNADRTWHVIDGDAQVLGRVATVAARLLQGKHKPRYTPFLDMGDHVVIVNAGRIRLTGRKEDQKLYRHHSGYLGGLREERAKVLRARRPTRMVEVAIRGMLPKTKTWERDVSQAEGLRRSRASPHGANSRPSTRCPELAVEYYGTGRRKTSTARVFLRPGSGDITVNRLPFQTRFPTESARTRILEPLVLSEAIEKFDILATAAGGGVSGQAGALRLGIARALVKFDQELRPRLKKAGMLTRDPRIKERKKYGLAGARKRFQFSKR